MLIGLVFLVQIAGLWSVGAVSRKISFLSEFGASFSGGCMFGAVDLCRVLFY